MALLDKTFRDVYDAMLTAYQTCKDKRQGANEALEIYEQNLELVEETKKALVDIDVFYLIWSLLFGEPITRLRRGVKVNLHFSHL